MIVGFVRKLRHDGLGARAFRSSAWTGMGFILSQVMRLASNLVLTRLLMPEAFGAMALVTAFIIGLVMFSDTGTGPAIQNSVRGDEPDFLDTIWTVQAIRGVTLWLFALALAWPLAVFYDEPILARIFPVAALGLVISGLMPTRMEWALRHLRVGLVTRLELISQVINICITIALTLVLRSIWGLILGGLIGGMVQILIMHLVLPGHRNRPKLEPAALKEIRRFGIWIFISTIFGFLIFQGDRLVMGRYLTLSELGIYNIAAFLGAVPMTLGQAIGGRLFMPLYREAPPSASAANLRRLSRYRMGLALGLMSIVAVLVFGGPGMVHLLYDERYAEAGVLVSVVALIQVPAIAVLGYDAVPLAAGDSRRMFRLQATRASIYIPILLLGAHFGGFTGILIAQAVTGLLMYPVSAAVARQYRALDLRTDLTVYGLALIIGCIFWLQTGRFLL